MTQPRFDPVPSPFDFSGAEREIIRFWKEQQVYKKSLDNRSGCDPFVFFEGPPTANGMPHPGHCLTRTIKDVYPRYKTMAGYFCERKAGWDTHGLPVEVEVCKQLGILDGGKAAIEQFGVERFNRACIDSVFRYQREWEELTERIGFWVDLEQAYVTYHQSYVESVWWVLKQFFDRGLLYQGHKVVWWWAQGGTALSAGEVGEGYRDVDDPAITVALHLDAESTKHLGLSHAPTYLLVWTTTPWTLPSNCAAAVGPGIEYAIVKTARADGSHAFYVLAAALVERYFDANAEVLRTVPGKSLIGLRYEPLFRYAEPVHMETGAPSHKHWEIVPGDFVDIETGTGVVHIAPAFGEDDYRACREHGIGFLCFVKPDGTFDERVTDADPFDGAPIAGQFCKAADKAIIRLLKERGLVLKHDQYRHAYPFCPRAENDPLIQYARKSWFIRTSQFKDRFLANNAAIGWQPEHIRDGRFGKFLESNVDWALSRERYWGTPLPVWVCEKTGHMECIASYAELRAKPGVQGVEVWDQAKVSDPALNDNLKVHKPYIDAVTYQSPKDPAARMRRVPEVIDVWFDAGSMPFAQWGYPHAEGSAERLAANFPADFISEAIDQTRGWFYALLAISTLAFSEQEGAWPHPFRNCICLGHIMGEDGLKLSKRLKNYTDPRELFEKYGADALRWSFMAKNPPTTSTRLSERIVEESLRELMVRWYNVYSFFVIYANLDGFDPAAHATEQAPRPAPERAELDRWIVNELARTVIDVRASLDRYETFPATRAIAAFLDALSNWYVRRSRARFWASGWSPDKADAYWTLYECLLAFSELCAPFVPFFSETVWRNLSKGLPGAPISVHLCDYPTADAAAIDRALLDEMALVREAVTLGLAARRAENLRVRQPLARCEIVVSDAAQRAALARHLELIGEELNIKDVAFCAQPEAYVRYEVRPNFKVLGPRFGKQVQAVKQALAAGDGAAFFRQLGEGGIRLALDGGEAVLSGEEVEVRLSAQPGFAASQGRNLVVVISTNIDEALRREGIMREFVRALQEIRKEMRLPYDARIRITLHTEDAELPSVIEAFREAIAGEVLASEIALAAAPLENARALDLCDGATAVSVAAV